MPAITFQIRLYLIISINVVFVFKILEINEAIKKHLLFSIVNPRQNKNKSDALTRMAGEKSLT